MTAREGAPRRLGGGGVLGRTLLRVLPVAALGFVAIAAFAILHVDRTVRREIEREVVQQNRHAAQVIAGRLSGLIEFAQVLAGNEMILNSLMDLDGRNLYLPPFFRSLRAPGPSRGKVTLADYTGRVIVASGGDSAAGDSAGGRIATTARATLTADVGGLRVVVPILVAGIAEGYIALSFTADDYAELFDVAAIDTRARILTDAGVALYAAGPVAPDGVVGWIEHSGRIGELGLTLVTAKADDEARSATLRILAVLAVAFGVALLILAGGVVLAAMSIARPLADFVRIVRDRRAERLMERIEPTGPAEIRQLAEAFNQSNAALAAEIAERLSVEGELRQMAERNQLLAKVIEHTTSGITIADARDPVLPLIYANPALYAITGYDAAEVIGRNCRFLAGPETDAAAQAEIRAALAEGRPITLEICNYRKDGSRFWNQLSIFPVHDDDGELRYFVGSQTDVTQRKQAEAETARLQQELMQASKMESLGTLAGGIAHEMNTPMQYVGDNLEFLTTSMNDLTTVLAAQEALISALDSGADWRPALDALRDAMVTADLGFLLEEIPAALAQTREGVDRVRQIVAAIKAFSHPDTGKLVEQDIAKAIETTATISRNQWKYVADLTTSFDPSLPPVACNPGELNQVILNLIVNAAHAIEDKAAGTRGKIEITTRKDGDWAEIRVSDSGVGIPADARSRVYDLFFTTKAPGRGTGQGLAISHSIITRKHNGTIGFESEVGTGTTFVIRLPIDGVGARAAAPSPIVPSPDRAVA